jgi:hypothetical protein
VLLSCVVVSILSVLCKGCCSGCRVVNDGEIVENAAGGGEEELGG